LLLAAAAWAGPAWSSEPAPEIAPPAPWVVPVAIPTLPGKPSDQAASVLSIGSQTLVKPDALETFVQFSMIANSVAGLQAIGTIAIPWNVERADVKLHRVSITRANDVIELLPKAQLTLLRRENNLEKA
jgi:hypothetical protein